MSEESAQGYIDQSNRPSRAEENVSGRAQGSASSVISIKSTSYLEQSRGESEQRYIPPINQPSRADISDSISQVFTVLYRTSRIWPSGWDTAVVVEDRRFFVRVLQIANRRSVRER